MGLRSYIQQAVQSTVYYGSNANRSTVLELLTLVTSGLVLNLDAGNTASYPGSGTTWTDLSPSSRNVTLTNGPSFNSENQGSIVFDGNNDYGIFNTSGLPSGNSALTFDAVVRWSGNGSNVNDIIISYGEDVGGGNRCPLLAIDASSRFTLQFGSGTGSVVSTGEISTNTWYHITAVYNLSQTILYINGSQNNQSNYTTANINLSGSNGSNGAIGALFSSFGNVGSPSRYGTFNGRVAYASIYNRALTAAEVAQNFNALRGRFGI